MAALAWGCSGYRLVAAEAGSAAQVLELTLAKSLPNSHRIVHAAGGEAGAGDAARRGALPEVHLLQVRSLCALHWVVLMSGSLNYVPHCVSELEIRLLQAPFLRTLHWLSGKSTRARVSHRQQMVCCHCASAAACPPAAGAFLAHSEAPGNFA